MVISQIQARFKCAFGALAFLLVFTATNVLFGQALEPDSLFADSPVELSAEQEGILANLAKLATTNDMRLVNINFDIFNRNKISLNLFPGLIINASKKKIKIRDVNTYTWFGDYINNTGSVALVVRNNNITATIHINNEIYTIRPIGSGIHVIIQVDWSKFPPDHPPEDSKNQPPGEPLQNNSMGGEFNKVDKSIRLGKAFVGSDDTIKVFVSYTPAAESAYGGDINSLIVNAVDETNVSYGNSNIDIELVLVGGFHEVTYSEVNNTVDRERLINPSDGYMDEVHDLRDGARADVVILLVENLSSCGKAGAILANPNLSFAVVSYDCAVGNFSFAHEIGHLQGARHDNDASTYPFPYGHGYSYPTDNWRTIMAVSNPSLTRLQYWSNPAVQYGGVPMGTSATSDNARVLNETAHILKNFRGINLSLENYSIPWGWTSVVYKATEQYQAAISITAGPSLVIEGGGDVSFAAGSKITLSPGFHAKEGSKFRAYIDPDLIPPPPPAPTGLAILNAGEDGEAPELWWYSSIGADYYKVYRQFYYASWENIATPSYNNYTDNGATLHPSYDTWLKYYVTAVNTWGESVPSDTVTDYGSLNKKSGIPTEYSLSPAYPNPFNPTATIKYALKDDVRATLKVYDLLGREVRVLVNEQQPAAYHAVVWDGRDRAGRPLPSGIYIARLVAGDFVAGIKMLLLK